jgi:hypothetical protein
MKKLITSLYLIIFSCTLWAQNVSFKASAPGSIAKGNQFRVVYTVNAQPSSFKNPSFTPFDVLMGPSTSSSTSISVVNGQMSQNVSYSYTFILSASKEGKFTISPAEITVNGKSYKSNSLSIEVVKGNATATTSNNQNSNANDNLSQPATVSNDDVFVRVNVNKTSLYQGEQLVAGIYIYTRLNIAGFEEMKFPDFNGFWSEDLENPTQISLHQEYVNGQLYSVGLLKKVILSPQRSGKLTIAPVQATIVVQQKVQKARRSIFDDFFGSYQNVTKKLTSPTVTINVKELPGNKPTPFSGGVGSFSLESHIDKTHLKMNEAFNYTLKLSGTGNIKLIEVPKPQFPNDFEVYEPKITNSFGNKDAGSSGSKTISYLVIPRHHGDYTIPGFDFNYFDLKSMSYKSVHINDVSLSVSKDSSQSASSVVSEFEKKDINVLGSDIRYIKKDIEPLNKFNNLIFGSIIYKLAFPFSLLTLLVLLFLRRNQIKQRSNLLAMRNRKANKVASKRLAIAYKCMKNNDENNFYEEINKALWGYLSDKLIIPMSELTRESAMEKLTAKQLDENIISGLNEILDNCEFARYAPSAITFKNTEIYEKASKIIRSLESVI